MLAKLPMKPSCCRVNGTEKENQTSLGEELEALCFIDAEACSSRLEASERVWKRRGICDSVLWHFDRRLRPGQSNILARQYLVVK